MSYSKLPWITDHIILQCIILKQNCFENNNNIKLKNMQNLKKKLINESSIHVKLWIKASAKWLNVNRNIYNIYIEIDYNWHYDAHFTDFSKPFKTSLLKSNENATSKDFKSFRTLQTITNAVPARTWRSITELLYCV